MFQSTTHRNSLSNDSQSAQSSSSQSYRPSAQEESALKQQEKLKERTQDESRVAVDEAARRMRHEAEVKTVQFQRQSLEGSAKHIDQMVRQGVTAKEVAENTKQANLGQLDYDLSRLTPPSFTKDERGKIREAYMRAVDTQAQAVEAEQLQHNEKLETEKRSQVEREKRESGVALSS
jgi:hypothetical protein